MAEEDREFEASYWRTLSTLRDGKDFIDAFYDRFLTARPDIPSYFENTDLEQQKRKLRLSLLFMTSFTGSDPSPTLRLIAERHGPSGENIPRELFDVWADALLATVRDYDPEATADTTLLWKRRIEPGVRFMQSNCR